MTDTITRREVEVDTQLAELWAKERAAQHRIETCTRDLRRYTKEEPAYYSRRNPVFNTSVREVVKQAKAMLEDGSFKSWDERTVKGLLWKIDANQQEAAEARVAAKPLEAEYNQHRWPRFFLVRNTGGHIHSSMACSTCRPTTDFGWLPDLSGLSEKDAVDAHGPLLCSVCFPSAPVEWTVGIQREYCAGSNKQPVEGTYRPRGFNKGYGRCPECDDTQMVTMSGIRKHKPKKES